MLDAVALSAPTDSNRYSNREMESELRHYRTDLQIGGECGPCPPALVEGNQEQPPVSQQLHFKSSAIHNIPIRGIISCPVEEPFIAEDEDEPIGRSVDSMFADNNADVPQPRSIDTFATNNNYNYNSTTTATTTTRSPLATSHAANVLHPCNHDDLCHTTSTTTATTTTTSTATTTTTITTRSKCSRSASGGGGDPGTLRDVKRLYGRSEEQQIILQAYQTAMRSSRQQQQQQQAEHHHKNHDNTTMTTTTTTTNNKKKNTLILIKGNVGMGKTAVAAQSLQDQVRNVDGGFFVTWKFDHDSNMETDGGFDIAFTSLCQQILSAGNQVVLEIRDTVHAQLDPMEHAVVVGMIPCLEPVIGPAETDFDFNGLEASGRQLDIFQKLLRALCSRDRPLVFLMDDIQFSDSCSHILFNRIFPDTDNDGIFFILTMGPEEQSADINKVLETLQETVNITTIELKPLDEEATNDMVADILKVEPEDSMPMTEFLYDFTKGNPLYVKELLRLMHQNGVLTFDEDIKSWHCNDERMECVYQCRDFEALTKNNLKRLSPQVRDVLKAGACLGAKLDVDVLDVIMAGPVVAHIQSAIAAGLVIAVDEDNGKYRFVNKGVRDAVYDLIPVEDRNAVHLNIGRKLLKGLDEDQLQESLSLVLSQIKHGASSMSNQQDRYATATLCLKAAEQSVQWSSFKMAAEWLDFAIVNLGDRCWRDEFDLSLIVYNMAAEIAYTVGDVALVFKQVEIVLTNARQFEHKLQAFCTKINALNVSGKVDEAIELGLDVLKQLDEPIQANPSAAVVAYETMRMKRFMKRKTPEKLRRLPTMTNNLKATAMQICNLLATPAIFKRPCLFPLLAFRALRITVSHGLCALSAVAFGLYGMVLVASPDNELLVKEYTKLSLELLERFDTKQWLPRITMITYGVINIWDNDMAASIKPLQRAYTVGLETGDYEFALLCKNISCSFVFNLGTPLPLVKSEMDSFTSQVMELNQSFMVYMHKSLVFMIESLMDSNSSAAFDEKLTNDPTTRDDACMGGAMSKCWVVFKRLILSYMVCDYARAAVYAEAITDITKMHYPTMDMACVVLFDALSRIAFGKSSGKMGRKSLGVVRCRLSLLKTFAKRNPDFCLGMQIFIEAELAALKGRKDVAAEKYLSCTSMFAHSKFLHLQAMASERAGKFMLECGKRERAKTYLRDSRNAFHEWGAMGKTASLDNEINVLFGNGQ